MARRPAPIDGAARDEVGSRRKRAWTSCSGVNAG